MMVNGWDMLHMKDRLPDISFADTDLKYTNFQI